MDCLIEDMAGLGDARNRDSLRRNQFPGGRFEGRPDQQVGSLTQAVFERLLRFIKPLEDFFSGKRLRAFR